jgi:Family of unknown function (DUF6082)
LRRRHRQAISRVTALTATLVILALVAFSPLALREISYLPNLNWTRLGNIGQTYGAVSAFLAALALIGVSVSVLLQLRETRFNRLEAGRTRHHELISMALENPSYFDIFGLLAFPSDMPAETRRSIAYINMYPQFQQMLWEFADISEPEVDIAARGLFSTSLGRDYWRRYGRIRLQNDNTKREREYDQTLDRIYKEAIASGPPDEVVPSLDPIVPRRKNFDRKIAASLIVTFLGGVSVGRFVYLARRRVQTTVHPADRNSL